MKLDINFICRTCKDANIQLAGTIVNNKNYELVQSEFYSFSDAVLHVVNTGHRQNHEVELVIFHE